jgi:beta-glucanase (GH16 family)
MVLLLSSTPWSLPMWLGNRKGPEGVLNGSAAMDLTGWSAASDAGTVTLTPARIGQGPAKARTGVDIQRKAGDGKWAMAMAELKAPQNLFRPGRTYQMRAYVRDLYASGKTIGMLLANDNHVHQPTQAARYEGYIDRSWHLLVRTFVGERSGFPDTRLYFALPPSGALHWQVTAASVREIPKTRPPRVKGKPTRELTFAGDAGTAPDQQVWNHEIGGHGWGNNEVQTYTAEVANARVDGAGHLLVTARREDTTGPDGIRRQYTSARITTKGKVEPRPGSYVEASVRAPVGRGIWPAFWLVGSDISSVGWPAAGELDVLEASGAQPTVARSRIHMASSTDPAADVPFPRNKDRGFVDLGHPLDTKTHLYGVYFDGTMVRFYIDRSEHLAFGIEDAVTSGRAWPFGRPQYLILNVAVNADAARTAFPARMVVDRIAIWEGGTPF